MNPDSSIMQTQAPVPIPASQLPASSSPSLKLVPATLLERYQSWYLNSSSWQGPLSTEQYISRENVLEHQRLTRDGKITYWILTDTSLSLGADGARPILATCETLRKEGYLGRNGNLEKLVTHGIGSVFCREDYRGRGYASRMMTELGKILDTWQQERGINASFSMLWSDIGQSFYAAHGWKAINSTHISLPVVSRQNSLQPQDQSDCSGVQNLTAQNLRDGICPKAISILEAKLRLHSEHRPDVPHIAIRPDYDHMEWHHAREDFQAKVLFDKEPRIKGAKDPTTGCALIWCRVWGVTSPGSKLQILHTVIPTDAKGDITGSIAALLLRAQVEAETWDMQGGVELWSPAPDVIKAAQSLAGIEKLQITIREKESICSLRWAGGDEEVEWAANERYCWC